MGRPLQIDPSDPPPILTCHLRAAGAMLVFGYSMAIFIAAIDIARAPSSAIRSTAQFCMAFLGSGLPSLVGGVCACVAASRIESFHDRVQDLMAGKPVGGPVMTENKQGCTTLGGLLRASTVLMLVHSGVLLVLLAVVTYLMVSLEREGGWAWFGNPDAKGWAMFVVFTGVLLAVVATSVYAAVVCWQGARKLSAYRRLLRRLRGHDAGEGDVEAPPRHYLRAAAAAAAAKTSGPPERNLKQLVGDLKGRYEQPMSVPLPSPGGALATLREAGLAGSRVAPRLEGTGGSRVQLSSSSSSSGGSESRPVVQARRWPALAASPSSLSSASSSSSSGSESDDDSSDASSRSEEEDGSVDAEEDDSVDAEEEDSSIIGQEEEASRVDISTATAAAAAAPKPSNASPASSASSSSSPPSPANAEPIGTIDIRAKKPAAAAARPQTPGKSPPPSLSMAVAATKLEDLLRALRTLESGQGREGKEQDDQDDHNDDHENRQPQQPPPPLGPAPYSLMSNRERHHRGRVRRPPPPPVQPPPMVVLLASD